MIIKATLVTLVVILVVVIATSYYINKEGFDDITNNLGSAINTVTPDAASAIVPPSSAIIPPLASVPLSAAIIPPSAVVPPSSAVVPPSAAIIPPSSAVVSPSSAVVQPSSAAIIPSSAAIIPSSAAIIPSSAVLPPSSAAIIPSSAVVAPSSAVVPPSSAVVPPSTTGSSPTRTDVVPQVSLSESGYTALMLQQKSDLLKDLQKLVRNEVLANRSTTPMLHNDGYGLEDDKNGCEPVKESGCGDNTWDNECGKKSTKDKVTAAISQGKEYENSCYKDKKAGASCPPPPDMAQFIKKDAIPCWGCNLDY
jgi:hypothetical protein